MFLVFFFVEHVSEKNQNWIGGWVGDVWPIRVFLGFLLRLSFKKISGIQGSGYFFNYITINLKLLFDILIMRHVYYGVFHFTRW